jgi:hypothetical protein
MKTIAKKIIKKVTKKKAAPKVMHDELKKYLRSLTRYAINGPLRIALAAKGCTLVRKADLEYYVDSKGGYVAYPPGFIRGPVTCSNGNPRPCQMSVQGHNGWLQRGFTQMECVNGVAEAWAIRTAVEVLYVDAQ